MSDADFLVARMSAFGRRTYTQTLLEWSVFDRRYKIIGLTRQVSTKEEIPFSRTIQ